MKAKEKQREVQEDQEEQQRQTQKKSRKQTEKEQLEAIQNVRSYGIANRKSRVTVKKILAVIGSLLILALVSMGIWKLLQGSYKDAIKAQMKIVNERENNLSICLDASVGELKKSFVMEYGALIDEMEGERDGFDAGMQKIFTDQYKQLSESFGNDFEVKYEIVEEKQLSQDELQNYYEDIGDYLMTSIQKINDNDTISDHKREKLTQLFQKWEGIYRNENVTDGYSVIVRFTYSSGNTSKEVKKNLIIVQLDGNWVIRAGGLLSVDSSKIFEIMDF